MKKIRSATIQGRINSRRGRSSLQTPGAAMQRQRGRPRLSQAFILGSARRRRKAEHEREQVRRIVRNRPLRSQHKSSAERGRARPPPAALLRLSPLRDPRGHSGVRSASAERLASRSKARHGGHSASGRSEEAQRVLQALARQQGVHLPHQSDGLSQCVHCLCGNAEPGRQCCALCCWLHAGDREGGAAG